MGSAETQRRAPLLLRPEGRDSGPGQDAARMSPSRTETWSPGRRGSASCHEVEVDTQPLVQEPGHHPSLDVRHKKATTAARLKQKARSTRWPRAAAFSHVLSSGWAMSTTSHASPTEEATKCSSYCSCSWSATGEGKVLKCQARPAPPPPPARTAAAPGPHRKGDQAGD